jgi:putative ribosome biogenesis GTPase RsgA
VEPDCALDRAAHDGGISPSRLASYRTLAEEALRAKAQRFR